MKHILVLLFLSSIAWSANSQLIDKIKKKAEGKGADKTTTEPGSYNIGETVDVWDPIEKGWFPSNILKKESEKYFVHFVGYESKWDTWVTVERIRPFGKGNKNDPGPATNNAVTNTGNGTGSSPQGNNENKKNDTKAASGSDLTSFPLLYYKDPSITFNPGDPAIITTSSGDKMQLVIVSLNYNGNDKELKFHSNYINSEEGFIKNIELIEGYEYKKFPAAPVDASSDEQFKIGDRVEVMVSPDPPSEMNKWVMALVVGLDGDNYYLYYPGVFTRWRNYDYGWHFKTDIRKPGSSKATVVIPAYDRENTNPNKKAYQEMLNNSPCNSLTGEDGCKFIWYYRHDFGRYDLTSALYNEGEFKKAMEMFECYNVIRKKYPDVGVDGWRPEDRFDVMAEYAANYKKYMAEAVKKFYGSGLSLFLHNTRTGYYDWELAQLKGLDLLKQKMKTEFAKYESYMALLGLPSSLPMADLETAYAEGVKAFMEKKTIANDGMKWDGYSYTGKDAKIEATCTAALQKTFPGTKILGSACYDNSFLIHKNNLGIPTDRSKSVVIVHQSPAFRTCIITWLVYKEDYQGGGKYGVGYVSAGSRNKYLKSCK